MDEIEKETTGEWEKAPMPTTVEWEKGVLLTTGEIKKAVMPRTGEIKKAGDVKAAGLFNNRAFTIKNITIGVLGVAVLYFGLKYFKIIKF